MKLCNCRRRRRRRRRRVGHSRITTQEKQRCRLLFRRVVYQVSRREGNGGGTRIQILAQEKDLPSVVSYERIS